MPEPHSNVGKLIRSTEVILNVPKYVPRPVWTNLKVMMGSNTFFCLLLCRIAPCRIAPCRIWCRHCVASFTFGYCGHFFLKNSKNVDFSSKNYYSPLSCLVFISTNLDPFVFFLRLEPILWM